MSSKENPSFNPLGNEVELHSSGGTQTATVLKLSHDSRPFPLPIALTCGELRPTASRSRSFPRPGARNGKRS